VGLYRGNISRIIAPNRNLGIGLAWTRGTAATYASYMSLIRIPASFCERSMRTYPRSTHARRVCSTGSGSCVSRIRCSSIVREAVSSMIAALMSTSSSSRVTRGISAMRARILGGSDDVRLRWSPCVVRVSLAQALFRIALGCTELHDSAHRGRNERVDPSHFISYSFRGTAPFYFFRSHPPQKKHQWSLGPLFFLKKYLARLAHRAPRLGQVPDRAASRISGPLGHCIGTIHERSSKRSLPFVEKSFYTACSQGTKKQSQARTRCLESIHFITSSARCICSTHTHARF
jgi:hypothetical protein